MRKSGNGNINRRKRKAEKNKRIIFLWVILFVVFAIIVYRTYDLQINRSDEYSKFFDSMRLKREEIPAYRGNIYDRNGNLLAYTRVNRYIDLSETFKGVYGSSRNELINSISQISGISLLNINDSINNDKDVLIRPDTSITNPNLVLEYTLERKYAFSGSISHIVGYVNGDLVGVAGVEKAFNTTLKGINGINQIEVDSKTRQLKNMMLRKPQKGQDLYLSIDINLQYYIEGLLSEHEKAVVIVSSPKSGEILGMVSKPFYESSQMSRPILQEEWTLIMNDESKSFLNRAISSTYNPGSLIKPFMALAVLSDNDESVYKAITQRLYCPGSFSLFSNDGSTEYKYRDWTNTGHGTVTLFDAIKKSCNVYFYNKGLELGIDYLKYVSDMTGFTQKSEIELPQEIEGIYPSASWKSQEIGQNWYLGDTILSSIGQGYVRLTPIEMLKLFELIALEGGKNKSHISANPFSLTRKYTHIPKSYWTYLKLSMNAVVSQRGGTAYSSFGDSDYKEKLAGKTGTAEIGQEGKYHALFAGFYPYDDPQYCVLVLIENGGYGGQTAAPIARDIFDYLITRQQNAL